MQTDLYALQDEVFNYLRTTKAMDGYKGDDALKYDGCVIPGKEGSNQGSLTITVKKYGTKMENNEKVLDETAEKDSDSVTLYVVEKARAITSMIVGNESHRILFFNVKPESPEISKKYMNTIVEKMACKMLGLRQPKTPKSDAPRKKPYKNQSGKGSKK